jgi:hypothetical protein
MILVICPVSDIARNGFYFPFDRKLDLISESLAHPVPNRSLFLIFFIEESPSSSRQRSRRIVVHPSLELPNFPFNHTLV